MSREMARRSKTVRHCTLFRAVSPKPTLPPNHILNRKPNPKTLTPTQTAPLTRCPSARCSVQNPPDCAALRLASRASARPASGGPGAAGSPSVPPSPDDSHGHGPVPHRGPSAVRGGAASPHLAARQQHTHPCACRRADPLTRRVALAGRFPVADPTADGLQVRRAGLRGHA